MFDRFYRVNNGSTRSSGGAGLGLYIAKRLVELMSGRLWVSPREGGGSVFSFTLPLAEDEQGHLPSDPGRVALLAAEAVRR